jgi:lysophospholipase L1-like esterase
MKAMPHGRLHTYLVLLILFTSGICEVHGDALRLRHNIAKEYTRVACLGDSMTEGAPGPPNNPQSYPVVMQKLLGKSYQVQNFGMGWASVTPVSGPSGPKAYADQPLFQAALAWKPHIVFIMLGTNDARGPHIAPENFVSYYSAMISRVKANAPQPRIILCIPPPAYALHFYGQVDGLNPEVINRDVPSLVLSVATANSLARPINIFGDFLDHCPDVKQLCDWMADGLHPSSPGYSRIAFLVASAVGSYRPVQDHIVPWHALSKTSDREANVTIRRSIANETGKL